MFTEIFDVLINILKVSNSLLGRDIHMHPSHKTFLKKIFSKFVFNYFDYSPEAISDKIFFSPLTPPPLSIPVFVMIIVFLPIDCRMKI